MIRRLGAGAALLLALAGCSSSPPATVAAPTATTAAAPTTTAPPTTAPTGTGVPVQPTPSTDLPTVPPSTTSDRGYTCDDDGTAKLSDGRSGYTASCVAEVGAATPRAYRTRIANRNQPTTDENCADGFADPYACYLDDVPAPYNSNGGQATPRCNGTTCTYPDGSVLPDPSAAGSGTSTSQVPDYQRCGIRCGEAPTSGDIMGCNAGELPPEICEQVANY